jgi:hypothetical protein
MSVAYLVNPSVGPETAYYGVEVAATQTLENGATPVNLSFTKAVSTTPLVTLTNAATPAFSSFTINSSGIYNLGVQINAVQSGTWTVLTQKLFIEVTRSSTAYILSGTSTSIPSATGFLMNIDGVHSLLSGDVIRFRFLHTLASGSTANTATLNTGGGTYAFITLLKSV